MNDKPNYYAIIPAEVRYSDIPANAKLLYGEITALANKEGFCWASNIYFAKLYNVKERAITDWVKKLSDMGFIKSIVLNDNSRQVYVSVKGSDNSLGGRRKITRGVGENSLYNNTYNTTDKKDFSKEKSLSSENDIPLNNTQVVKLGTDGDEVEKEEKSRKIPSSVLVINNQFRELCEKHIGEKPRLEIGKQGAIIKSALKVLSESNIYDLFDWWFNDPQKGKEDYDLIQITQALSSYNIDKYKVVCKI